MGQTNTLKDIARAQLGDFADSDSVRGRVESYVVENDEIVRPGYFVSRGTNDEDIKIPASAGDKIAGVIVNGSRRVLDKDTGIKENYGQNDQVGVATEGVIYVYTEEAAAIDAPVFVRHTASGGNTIVGTVRTDADTATAVAVNAKFAETVAAAGIVKIKLLMAQV